MLTVVWVHANYLGTTTVANWWPGGYLAPFVYGLAVPTFYMISGYVLAVRDDLEAPLDLRSYLKARLTRLIIPFWVWTAIMFGVAWVAAPAMLDPSRVVLYAVGGFLQLHYVFCLMQFFLIYALWRTRLRNAGATRSLIIAALVSVGIFGGSSLEVWLAGADDGFVEEVLNRVSLTWSVFFFFGVWLGQRPTRLERLARWAPLWLLLTFVLYVPAGLEARHWDLTFGGTPPRMQVLAGSLWYAFMGGLALLTLAYRLDRTRLGRKALRPLSWLGADSMGVYMSHTTFLMLAAYCVIEWGLGQTSWSTVPALGGVALLTSWAFVRLLRLRFLAWPAFVLFGRRPPRRP